MRRRLLTVTFAATMLAACGGSTETASSPDDASDASTQETINEAASDTGPAAQAALDEIVAAIQAVPEYGYQCTPESIAMTSAVRSICIGFSSVGVNAYAWGDAATMAAEVGSEVYCSADSGLGSLTSVRGENWAISLVPTGGVSPEAEATIAELATALSAGTGGASQTDACS